ncbi:MAG: arsenite methyltransferase [Candidatus Zixiibacteriota bacterium]|nr:MAG: arsenite methyltransferase [candidate division Zixibacteria bacterium]
MMKKSHEEIKKAVREHYGQAVAHRSECCGGSSRVQLEEQGAGTDPLQGVASFGCGSPLAFANIAPGDTVLDLGAGAGPDLIMAARKVGPEGKAIGLDMTPEMIDACRRNLEAAGIENAEVRQGEMENMPVADAEVDWIISNCVINLSPDKEKVFAEAFRVLKPGGQMLVSDIVTVGLPQALRENMTAWVGCIAGAVEQDEYIRLAREAGFENVRVVDKYEYSESSLCALTEGCSCGCDDDKASPDMSHAGDLAGRIASVRLYARKRK